MNSKWVNKMISDDNEFPQSIMAMQFNKVRYIVPNVSKIEFVY